MQQIFCWHHRKKILTKQVNYTIMFVYLQVVKNNYFCRYSRARDKLFLMTEKIFLIYDVHCTKAVASAMSSFHDQKVICQKVVSCFYKTYVRPDLEYYASIWSPNLAKDIDALEKVQRHATKMVRGLGLLSYEQRLKLPSFLVSVLFIDPYFILKVINF